MGKIVTCFMSLAEWCCEEYSNKVAQVVKICDPFQGAEYENLRMLAKMFKQRLYE